jgi:CheY-like chemotaxis protein
VSEAKQRSLPARRKLDRYDRFNPPRRRRHPRELDQLVAIDAQKSPVVRVALAFEISLEKIRRIDLALHQTLAISMDSREPLTTVLYVEDNLSNAALMERIMATRPNIKLLLAMQGRMGLDLAREHVPDLILLDVHLPDMRGDEVLLQLRADPRTKHIAVAMVSADATPGQVERLLTAGAQTYLTKPLDVKKLLGFIDETLQSRAIDRDAAAALGPRR